MKTGLGLFELDQRDLVVSSLFSDRGPRGRIDAASLLGRLVLVKVPRPGRLLPDQLRSFLRSHEAARTLPARHVLSMLGAVRTVDPSVGFVFARQACSLADLIHHRDALPPSLAARPLTPELKRALAVDCVEGLRLLHGAGVVHRNVKPTNFLVDEHLAVRIADFADPTASARDLLSRSLPYAAPELLRGEDPTFATDVHAVGVVLWELFAELAPFDGVSGEETRRAIAAGVPLDLPRRAIKQAYREARTMDMKAVERRCMERPRVRLLRGRIGAAVEAAIRDCWHKRPARRQTADELQARLSHACLVGDLGGFWHADFWVHAFSGRGGAPAAAATLRELAPRLRRALGVTEDEVAAAAPILADAGEVSRARFAWLCGAFGPFYADAHTLRGVAALAAAPWYCPSGKEGAQAMLAGKVDGTFLVRSSTSVPTAPFTVSGRRNGKTYHCRVERREGAYVCALAGTTVRAATVPGLVEELAAQGLVGDPCTTDQVVEY